MSKPRPLATFLPPRLAAAAALLAAGLTLAGCSSAIDMIPTQVGGLPANAPARPENAPEYPNVYATPAPRETRPLTDDEQKKLEKELTEIRDRQAGTAKPEEKGKAKPADKGKAKQGQARRPSEPVDIAPKTRSP
jgi:hypothetical protein